MNCEDCKDTGYIFTEGIKINKPIFVDGQLIYRFIADGKWKKTICPCKSDNDDEDEE